MRATRVNPTPKQQHVGDYYSAAWTASSSNGNAQQVTGTITLPAGMYLIVIALPIISTSTFACGLRSGNSGVGNIYHVGAGQSSKTVILRVASTISLYVGSAQSDPCTFSYRERGGLYAVRLA